MNKSAIPLCLECGYARESIVHTAVGENHHVFKTPLECVNHPAHYNAHPAGIECIAIVEHMTFNAGNAVKYVWRAGLKSENPIEDLKKAAWYIAREIERLSK